MERASLAALQWNGVGSGQPPLVQYPCGWGRRHFWRTGCVSCRVFFATPGSLRSRLAIPVQAITSIIPSHASQRRMLTPLQTESKGLVFRTAVQQALELLALLRSQLARTVAGLLIELEQLPRLTDGFFAVACRFKSGYKL